MRLVMRMDSRVSGLFLAVILLAAATATQARHWGGDVEVIGDGGQTFATYPLERRSTGYVANV